ncbi:hypothetical protein M422DRAFT_239301 [Sphaerobolus stellatus SS14]|nr:hypothetical protein M422DRAFT_239301 [Sphaerobolus stellatus SS14]
MEAVMHAHWMEDKWFDYTSRGKQPHLVNEIALTADLHSCNVDTNDLIVCHCALNWKRKSVIKEMKDWCSEMDEGQFLHGCVEEIFLFTYAVHMVAGPGGQGNKEWCKQAVGITTKWLKNGVMAQEPGVITKWQDALQAEHGKQRETYDAQNSFFQELTELLRPDTKYTW